MEINSSGEETVIKVSCYWIFPLIFVERINIFLIFVCRCGSRTQSQNNESGGPRQSTNGSLKPSNCMAELGSALKVNFCIYHTSSTEFIDLHSLIFSKEMLDDY